MPMWLSQTQGTCAGRRSGPRLKSRLSSHSSTCPHILGHQCGVVWCGHALNSGPWQWFQLLAPCELVGWFGLQGPVTWSPASRTRFRPYTTLLLSESGS